MKRYTVETRFTMGFAPAAMSLLDILARERATSEGELIRTAVLALLDHVDAGGEIRPPARQSDASGVIGAGWGDFDPLEDFVIHRGIKPRYTRPGEVHLDAPTTGRLETFCHAAKLSKAWAVRLAVDRYLFEHVVNTGPGQGEGGPGRSMPKYAAADTASDAPIC